MHHYRKPPHITDTTTCNTDRRPRTWKVQEETRRDTGTNMDIGDTALDKHFLHNYNVGGPVLRRGKEAGSCRGNGAQG